MPINATTVLNYVYTLHLAIALVAQFTYFVPGRPGTVDLRTVTRTPSTHARHAAAPTCTHGTPARTHVQQSSLQPLAAITACPVMAVAVAVPCTLITSSRPLPLPPHAPPWYTVATPWRKHPHKHPRSCVANVAPPPHTVTRHHRHCRHYMPRRRRACMGYPQCPAAVAALYRRGALLHARVHMHMRGRATASAATLPSPLAQPLPHCQLYDSLSQ